MICCTLVVVFESKQTSFEKKNAISAVVFFRCSHRRTVIIFSETLYVRWILRRSLTPFVGTCSICAEYEQAIVELVAKCESYRNLDSLGIWEWSRELLFVTHGTRRQLNDTQQSTNESDRHDSCLLTSATSCTRATRGSNVQTQAYVD